MFLTPGLTFSRAWIWYNIPCRGGGARAQVPGQRLREPEALGHSSQSSTILVTGAPTSLCHIRPGYAGWRGDQALRLKARLKVLDIVHLGPLPDTEKDCDGT